MSRTPQARTTSRTGQVPLCAVCVADAGGYGSVGLMKQLTWMLEIPPESDTSARLGGRARTWFCRTCIESIFKIDTIFAERNGHLELLDPQWWNDPATDAQIAYLSGLLDQRAVPEDLAREIDTTVERATKGQVSRWLSLLDVAPWKPRDSDAVVQLGPREVVH